MKHESEKQQKSIKEIIVLKKQFASTHLTVVVFVCFFFLCIFSKYNQIVFKVLQSMNRRRRQKILQLSHHFIYSKNVKLTM